MREFLKVRFWLGVFVVAWCLPGFCVADPLKFSLGAVVTERYNDNVFFVADDTEDDFITHYRPWVQLGLVKEALEFRLGGRADIYDYNENDDLDAVDQSYDGTLTNRWSSRFSTTLTASYLDDERRERELSETGLLFDDDDRQRQTYGLQGQYSLSELSTMSLSYTYMVEDFDDDLTYDLRGHTAQWVLSRNLAPYSERTTASLVLAGSYYEYDREYDTTDALFGTIALDVDDEQAVEYYAMRLGLAHNRTEKLMINADVGARFTRNERSQVLDYEPNAFFADSSSTQEDESWGYVANLEAIYSAEKWEFSALASHDLVPASGRNGTIERTTLRLGGRGRMASKWHYHWSARGYLNNSDDTDVTSEEDELTVLLRLGIRYAFNLRWSLGLNWRTYWIDDRQNDEDKTQNTVSLRLAWNLPIFE